MTLAVYPITSKPNTAEAALGTASETTLTMTTSQDSASVALNPVGENGSFAASTTAESAAFSVTSNNITGYTLTMSNSSSTGELVSSTDSLTSISSITSLTDFSADTAAAASNYNGKWGYLPSKYNGTSNTTNYYPAPISTDPTPATLDTTNAPNSTANEYTIGIGARADMNKAAGAYTGTFVLQAIGNIVPYVISYADNSRDSTVTGAPINPSTPTTGNISGGTPSGESITTLATSIPTRTGYTFKSWCDGTVSSNGTVCTGTEYSSGANFPIDQTTQNTTTLYAIWTLNTYTITISNSNTTSGADSITVPYGGSNTVTVTPASGYYLSNVSCPTGYTCSGYSTGTSSTSTQTVTISNDNTTSGGTLGFTGTLAAKPIQEFDFAECTTTSQTVYDTRDNERYLIQRLADGNCWMLDNLRLGSTSTIALTSSDTNIASDWTLPASSSSGFNKYDTAMINTVSKDTINSDASLNWGNGSHKYGVYYNYCAASGGTYCYASGSGTGNASYDICPKGWRMPTGGSGGEYQALYTAYSSNATNFRNALSTPLSGEFRDSYAYAQGSYGIFLSSTYYNYNGNGMYRLSVTSSNVLLTSYDNRNLGYSVRCLLETRTPFEKLQAGVLTMQDIGNLSSSEKSTLISQMADSTVYHATDSRDNQVYDVAKLNGQMWMAENLNLTAPTVDLTSSNTNLSNTVTQATFTGWQKTSGSQTNIAGEFIPVSGTDSTSGTAYGTLYNYCAASAGTICADDNFSDASYDICPKGWRLPTGGSSGEFQTLYNNSSYNSNAKMRAPISQGGAAFALAGRFESSTPGYQGIRGDYWSSSTPLEYDTMRCLTLFTSGVYPATTSLRRSGQSIRCVLK